jgi:serine/threonine protein kinase/WD40 repeat protein
MGTQEERGRVRSAIRGLMDADRAADGLKPREHYKALFAGHSDLVAEEHQNVSSGSAQMGATATSDRPGTPMPSMPAYPDLPLEVEQLGPYKVLMELGRGGMGVVYLAEDTRLPRKVALKVLPAHFASSKHLQLRFHREAALASKLDHPNICTVYEAGEADGTPYMAMRLLEGKPLSEWVGLSRESRRPSGVVTLPPLEEKPPEARAATGEQRNDLDRILLLMEKAARALHVAHEKGLIHRDIKPHNIMVTAEGEPVLLDFGLAREEEGEGQGLTQTGSLMGTPAYLSPEQLAAQRIKLDRRTDVYSLGVTLYECLTLRLPFEAPTLDGLYQKILMTEPEEPRRLNKAIPKDLQVVVDTAIERNRERRYQTAEDLAEELRRVREHEPIRAKPVGPLGRLARWSQRSPGMAASISALFLSLTGGLALSLNFLKAARMERDAKEYALEAEKKARGDRERALAESRASLEASQRSLRTARALALANSSSVAARVESMAALLLAREAARLDPRPEILLRLHEAILDSPERTRIPCRPKRAALTPDGRHVLAANFDGSVVLWDLRGREVHRLAVPAGSEAAIEELLCDGPGRRGAGFQVEPAGGSLLCWNPAGAELWDADGALTARLTAPAGERLLDGALTPGGPRLLFLRVAANAAVVRDLAGRVLSEHPAARHPIAWGELVPATGGVITIAGREVVLRDAGGRVLASREWPEEKERFVLTSPRGAVLVMSDTCVDEIDGEALWLPDGRPLAAPAKVERNPRFSPDGGLLAYTSRRGGVGILDLATGNPRPLEGRLLECGAFTEDGKSILASTGGDFAQGLALRSLDGKKVVEFKGNAGVLHLFRITDDRCHVCAEGSDGRLRLWALDGRPVADMPASDTHFAVAVSADGGRLLLQGRDGLRLLDLDSREVGHLKEKDRGGMACAAFLPGGRGIVTTDMSGNGRLWSLEGEVKASLAVRLGGMVEINARAPVLLPGGERVLLRHFDGIARIWTLDGRMAGALGGEGDFQHDLVLSADGRLLAGLADDGGARLWSIDGKEIARLPREEGRIDSVSISPDGTRVLTVASGGRATVWDAAGRRTGVTLQVDGTERIGAWSPAGNRILTCGEKGSTLWSTEGAKLLAIPTLGKNISSGGAFTPQGDAVLATTGGRVTWLVDLEGRLLATFRGSGAVTDASGTRILTLDEQAHLWDRTGREIASFPRREEGIDFAILSPDGKMVLTLENREAFVWLADAKDLLDLADSRITRDFTPEEREKYKDLLGEPAGAGK